MSILKFHPAQGNVPYASCNSCGSEKPILLTAEHPLDPEILIVACSEKCATRINNHPELQGYLLKLYANIQELKGGQS